MSLSNIQQRVTGWQVSGQLAQFTSIKPINYKEVLVKKNNKEVLVKKNSQSEVFLR